MGLKTDTVQDVGFTAGFKIQGLGFRVQEIVLEVLGPQLNVASVLNVMRALRLARIFRLLRVFRRIRALRELQKLVPHTRLVGSLDSSQNNIKPRTVPFFSGE